MSFDADKHSARLQVRRVELVETRDDGPLQRVTVMGYEGERIKLAHRVQMFGDSSHAPPGAHGLALFVNGRPDQTILLGLEHQDHRPKNMPVGERVLYNAHGDKIFMYKEHMKVVTKKYEVVADEIILDGVCYVGGKDGALPASRQGTVDTCGCADTANFATRVRLK